MKLYGLLLAATIISCVVQQRANAQPPQFSAPPPYSGPAWLRYPSTQSDQARAENLVRATLKDPESASFKDFSRVSRGKGDDKICGQANAKNSYGGYVGYRQFYVDADGKVRFEGSEVDTLLVKSVCSMPAAPQGLDKE